MIKFFLAVWFGNKTQNWNLLFLRRKVKVKNQVDLLKMSAFNFPIKHICFFQFSHVFWINSETSFYSQKLASLVRKQKQRQ